MDKREAHVGNGGAAVQPALLLHLADYMFQGLLFVIVQRQLREYVLVALYDAAGGKTDREAAGFGMVFNEMHYSVEASVHGAALFVGQTEVLP